jgi:tetratricopeptide (TPR) repeat protein
MCHVYGLQNYYARAGEVIRAGLELARTGAAPTDQANACYQAGLISYRQDDYGGAETYLRQALELYETIDTPEALARQAGCLDALAGCWSRREGARARVLETQERALAIWRGLGDRQGEHECLMSLSNLYLMRGDLGRALASADAMLLFFRAANAREQIAQCQYLRGEALARAGRLEDGLAALGEALDLCRGMGRAAAAQFVQIYLGRAFGALGRYQAARDMLEQAAASDDRLIRARALGALAELCLTQGDLALAFELASESLWLMRLVGVGPLLGRALRVLGQVRAADDSGVSPLPDEAFPAAEACFRSSAMLLEEACYEGDLGETLAAYGEWLLGEGRAAEAYVALGQARERFVACGMPRAIERIEQIVSLPEKQPADVVHVRLPRHDAPRGRPLRPDELVPVRWTLDDGGVVAGNAGPIERRRALLRRLCAEANVQDAEPTVVDLAAALGVTTRTVSRDLAAMRAAGENLPTRGS